MPQQSYNSHPFLPTLKLAMIPHPHHQQDLVMLNTLSKTLLLLASLSLFGTAFASDHGEKKEHDHHDNSSVKVKIETTQGDMVLELYPDKAPKTVKNFLRYVDEGFYSDTIFHRVIANFMIQGGGFDKSYNKKKTHDQIENEADNGLENRYGTVAMARTSNPHSATAQFFINSTNNRFLNHSRKSSRGWGYCVFGKIVDGDDVIKKISALKTGAGGTFPKDVPEPQVVITKISRL